MTERRLDMSGHRSPQPHWVIDDPCTHGAATALEGFWDRATLPLAPPDGSDEDVDPLAYWLQAHLGCKPGDEHASIALVDWTSLLHVAELFDGNLHHVDRFVALADLAAVLAAVLFHDRVVVIDGDYSDVAHRVSSALGVKGVITSLRFPR